MKEEKNRPENNEKEENENNNSETRSIINRFGIKTATTTTAREPINIAKIKEIENELKQGEAIQITNIQEFAAYIGVNATDAITIRNKIYREYQKGNIDLKPVMRDRFLYLVKK